MLAKTLMFVSLIAPFVGTLIFANPAMAESHSVLSAASTVYGVATTTTGVQQEKVNINQASAEQLARVLRGVGMARAQAIIELREKLGGFKDMEDLLQVRGLGVKVLEDNRDRIEL